MRCLTLFCKKIRNCGVHSIRQNFINMKLTCKPKFYLRRMYVCIRCVTLICKTLRNYRVHSTSSEFFKHKIYIQTTLNEACWNLQYINGLSSDLIEVISFIQTYTHYKENK